MECGQCIVSVKVRLSQTEERQPKLLKLERGNTASIDQSQASILTINQSQASKISFDDTMDIDRSHARCHALEPDSSDEDEARERYR